MLRFLETLAKRFRLGSLERGDFSEDGSRPVENVDAGAASRSQGDRGVGIGNTAPPGYVKSYDEGRPRT